MMSLLQHPATDRDKVSREVNRFARERRRAVTASRQRENGHPRPGCCALLSYQPNQNVGQIQRMSRSLFSRRHQTSLATRFLLFFYFHSPVVEAVNNQLILDVFVIRNEIAHAWRCLDDDNGNDTRTMVSS